MRVIDCENWAWFLYEHDGGLFLDANCNMSAFGYTYMIRLNEQELQNYQNGGRAYLNKLAQDISQSVPIAKETKSIYTGRNVSKELSKLATETVKTWRTENNGN